MIFIGSLKLSKLLLHSPLNMRAVRLPLKKKPATRNARLQTFVRLLGTLFWPDVTLTETRNSSP